MRKFEFSNNVKPKLLTLDIEGNVFTFNPNTLKVTKAAEKYTIVSTPLINRLQKGKLDNDELTQIVIKSCKQVEEAIDDILGDEAYIKIFGGRTVDFEDHQELLTYVFNAITDYARENNHAKHTPTALS